MSDADEASVAELAEDLRVSVGRLVRSTRARADELSRGRAETLARLEAAGGQTIAQLAAHRGVRHQAMSRCVTELDDLGLVRREQSPTDARASVILLSAAGREALARGRAARRDVLATAIVERLDDDERALLRRVPALLRKITP